MMNNKIYRLIKPFLLMAFSFFLITSCYQPVTQKLDITSAIPSECRVVKHKLGETCIPVKPQRVIALDSSGILDSLLALGIKPIGMTFINHLGRKLFHGLSADEIAGIELVGTNEQPSIEKILMLKPDLILSLQNNEGIYKQLSAIAPTVILEVDEYNLSIKESFKTIAKILDKEKEAQQVLIQYQKKAKALKELLEDQLKEIEVSYIIYNQGVFYVPASSATAFQVLTDVGVRIKPILLEKNQWLPMSIEVISKYDADILFILNPDNKPSSYFLDNPLISSLKSFKNQQVYVIDAAIWAPYGPLGMNKLLDDIPKYLLKPILSG